MQIMYTLQQSHGLADVYPGLMVMVSKVVRPKTYLEYPEEINVQINLLHLLKHSFAFLLFKDMLPTEAGISLL